MMLLPGSFLQDSNPVRHRHNKQFELCVCVCVRVRVWPCGNGFMLPEGWWTERGLSQ